MERPGRCVQRLLLLLAVFSVLDVTLSAPAPQSKEVLSDSLIQYVNSKGVGWKAGRSSYFEGKTRADVVRLMGVKNATAPSSSLPRLSRPMSSTQLPASFDARAQWPRCAGVVLDQGSCGSCWAVAAAAALSFRLCVASPPSQPYIQLAALDLVACDSDFQNEGCLGGFPDRAWKWVKAHGIVSSTCLPYLQSEGGPIPTCGGVNEPCTLNASTPMCTEFCANPSKLSYEDDKHFLKSTYSLSSYDIAQEILAHGPVEVTMSVYEDFIHYKTGVYSHVTGDFAGYHAIAVVGWGEEEGKPYWLVQNSWTTTWGDNGMFKIARGTNECGIETAAVAGLF